MTKRDELLLRKIRNLIRATERLQDEDRVLGLVAAGKTLTPDERKVQVRVARRCRYHSDGREVGTLQ